MLTLRNQSVRLCQARVVSKVLCLGPCRKFSFAPSQRRCPTSQHRPPQRSGGPSVRSDSQPSSPEGPIHTDVFGPQEPEGPRLLGFTFSELCYNLNLVYWGLLLVSILSANDFISQLVRFEVYTTAMFAASAVFTLYHTVRFVRDVRQHLQSEARCDWRLMLRYCWNAVFWLGFVLWYAAPPVAAVAEYAGTPGAVACLFGAVLAIASALQAGMFSFLGSPQVPQRLQTTGVYALLRHPQALGNMLFLIGFSLAGGALWASLSFMAAFAMYRATVLREEERMLCEAFGDKYTLYMKRTPAFAWALVLLFVLELLLLWRMQPWAIPIEVTLPPGLPS